MAHKTLGGMAAIMFGDFLQLPPVGDSALFSTKESPGPHGQLATEGHKAYEVLIHNLGRSFPPARRLTSTDCI
jgi:hypothetical protein